MKRAWVIGGVAALMAALAATVVLAETGTTAPGTRFQGRGPGMMGRGGFAGDSALYNGQNYDPAAMATREEAMLVNHKAVVTNLETQLAAATDANVKAFLTSRIERQKIQLAWTEGRLPVVKALPKDWLTGA